MKLNTLWKVLLGIAGVALAICILLPPGIPGHGRERARRASCMSNLKQIGLALAQYARDYDADFPPTKSSMGGWVALLQPYAKSEPIFQCPSDRSSAGKTSDYFFNARLAGAATTKLAAPASIIALGDGLSDQSFDAHLRQLPVSWTSDSASPAYRHFDGANYGFADGHVKWFKPQKITIDKPSAGKPTFLIR